jgi:hypothetical protein
MKQSRRLALVAVEGRSPDCFAEPVIGPATSGQTRWLAMTGVVQRRVSQLSAFSIAIQPWIPACAGMSE